MIIFIVSYALYFYENFMSVYLLNETMLKIVGYKYWKGLFLNYMTKIAYKRHFIIISLLYKSFYCTHYCSACTDAVL